MLTATGARGHLQPPSALAVESLATHLAELAALTHISRCLTRHGRCHISAIGLSFFCSHGALPRQALNLWTRRAPAIPGRDERVSGYPNARASSSCSGKGLRKTNHAGCGLRHCQDASWLLRARGNRWHAERNARPKNRGFEARTVRRGGRRRLAKATQAAAAKSQEDGQRANKFRCVMAPSLLLALRPADSSHLLSAALPRRYAAGRRQLASLPS